MVFVKRETRFLLWSAIVFLAIGLMLTAIRVSTFDIIFRVDERRNRKEMRLSSVET